MRKSLWILTSLLILMTSVGLVGAWGTNQQVACDFVTGGGFIVGAGGSSLAAGVHGNFGVGGGVKNGAFWGHLEYNDHGTTPPMQIHGTSVTGYFAVSPTEREIDGTCRINGVDGFTYRVRVNDLGEPGINRDQFSILINETGYHAGFYFGDGPIRGGNIQLHKGNASNTPPQGFTCQ